MTHGGRHRAGGGRALVAICVAITWLGGHAPLRAAVAVSLTTGSYGQTFDGMANTAASALPTGWAFASGTAPTWTTGTLAATTQYAGTLGSGTLTSSSQGGAYLFVSGTAASGTDKAIGFLTSNTFTSPRSILFGFTNDTGSTISAVDVGWAYEKYRNGTRAFDWRFFSSADGAAWTAATAGDKSYPADAAISTIPVATSVVSPFRLSGLSIVSGGSFYLRWDYAGVGGSTSAQALGIDGFTLAVTGTGPSVYGTFWDADPAAPGVGGTGTWSAASPLFATSIDGTTTGTLLPSGTAVFAGTAGAVTVSGTVTAGGLDFMTDGYAITGGSIRLPAAATVSAAAEISAQIESGIVQIAGGTTSLDIAVGSTLLLSGTITGSGGLGKLGGGEAILAADNLFAGDTVVDDGSVRLGIGEVSGSVAGPVRLLAPTAGIVLDRGDDLVFSNSVSGSGRLAKEGGNTVTLTGSSSYTGGTTLFAGTLVVGDGGTQGAIASAGPLELSTGTQLVFDRSDDVLFSGTIGGDGSLVQRGDGQLSLSQPGRIGDLFTLRIEGGVATLDRSGGSLVGMLAAGNTVELAGGVLELSAGSGSATRLVGPAIRVDGHGTITINRQGTAGDHATTGFDCPIFVAGSGTTSGTLAFDYSGAFVGPTLPPVRYRGTTTYTGPTTLESDATVSVTNSAGGTAEVILAGPLTDGGGGFALTKTGDETLTLAGSGTGFSGPVTIAAGTLRLAAADALPGSVAVVKAGGTLAVVAALNTTVGGLDLAGAGLVDVTSGFVTVAAGLSATDLVAQILAGRGDGSWTGTSGITSSTAAADIALGASRAVGWLDNGDGSLAFAYAAPGDTNLDWQVDVLDAANVLASGKFNTGDPATWAEGDFNYDGVVDVLDAADFITTGLYNAGPYNPPAGVDSGVAAVPEPARLSALAVGIAACLPWLMACRRRRSSTGPSPAGAA
jgi:autotransporter-associated beta strand protein